MTRSAQPAAPALPDAIGAVRRLAHALRAHPEEAALAGLLNEVLGTIPLLQQSRVQIGPPAGMQETFAPGVLTLPLRGETALRGVLRHPLEGEPLGSTELNILHAAADLLGAVTELAAVARAGRRLVALLQFTAEQMPFGVICFGADGAVLACNRAAAAFLGEVPGPESDALARALAAAGPAAARTRCVSSAGGLGLVHLHPLSGGGGGVALVRDASAAMAAFRELVARETYRCLYDRRSLTLAVLDTHSGIGPFLLGTEQLRARLPAPAACGPLAPDAFGILLPEMEGPTAARLLRGWEDLRCVHGMRVGMAGLRPAIQSPDDLIRAALDARSAWSGSLLPDIFVCDSSPAVTETLELVLQASCAVTCANDPDRGLEMLQERSFDGLFLELASAGETGAEDFLHRAVALQPAARPFFVTELPRPWDLSERGLPPGPVFRKPFAVQEVRAAVRAAFSLDA